MSQETSNVEEHPSDYYDRYSRQHYVLGEAAMNRMAKSNVFISGLGGVGVEIAKDVALAGVKKLTLHDTALASFGDLSTQYYLKESDVGKNRAEVTFPKIAELNPYVAYTLDTRELGVGTTDFSFLKDFTCVVLTQKPLELQLAIGDYCHAQGIAFITADTYGAFGWAFSDSGKDHEVVDKNGEQIKHVMVEKIEKGAGETTITSLEHHMHGLEEGDYVKFTEVQGLPEINYSAGQEYIHQVKRVVTPYQFVVATDSAAWAGEYTLGGIVTQVKVPTTMHFLSMREALQKPEFAIPDFFKFSNPAVTHIGMQALHAWMAEHNGERPGAWNVEHAAQIVAKAQEINQAASAPAKVDELDTKLIQQLSFTARGDIIGMTAFLGGTVAQEVIKSLSGKFTPLNQWLYVDTVEILPNHEDAGFSAAEHQPTQSRYDAQRVLLGQKLHDQIVNAKTFMIGAGAIGCEMMKNFAMLGISTGPLGKITITDNDLIEKSNLNRQFLFRDADLQKPKSATAARAVKTMNPDMQVEAFLDKVCQESEATYSDAFFQSLDFVVNALDNVAARLYVDGRCVVNQRALLESGTLGTKGHVQVIIPHLTESYASQHDPADESFPVCTVKSFPSAIEHTIQWARSKFESLFVVKPSEVQKFFSDRTAYLGTLKTSNGPKMGALRNLVKLLQKRPQSFDECITFARSKFQSYYTNLILHLLNAFPLDTVLKDGTLFWKSPKRPPVAQTFTLDDPQHLAFILAAAQLYGNVFNIKAEPKQLERGYVASVLDAFVVPPFKPRNKKIETDPNAKEKPEEVDSNELDNLVQQLTALAESAPVFEVLPQEFEKDDDRNHHIDFITACSNLRAINYKLDPVDRLETKRIAGKIIPAIATTTAAVAGLVSLELVKLVQKLPVDKFKNCFLNLALPYFQLSEPGPAPKKFITKETYFTLWDRWEVQLGDILVEEFVKYFMDKYKLTVNGIFQGVMSLYVPIMPMHKPRLKKKLSSLIKNVPEGQTYVDLVVSFQDDKGEEAAGPSVRFFWTK